ncbi:hypothetical protein CcaverHIS002_0104410 [Cutaneotrichosporon cavernicola]|uniref:CLASP N-terminal domain-containing protein n=1 Tax=Cutaneotrichosporon cavernicola TaxID=279322 RepID=A0AA48I1K2_9TREE|nr:uncharacterized protein CcaverHIS019_0104350 [Cutaneotrichosporon cavernicola]BEI79912.1 hypothetical protein CcaverHIS002_0104410 [Cutaneotrichosporon cavernicola]BEI87717.1 hypothetical protein CcaverHIS019_0104350 [Cutaneotrichosporon cavernicola]BEI95488.1 hypothetical protein CcaverHIS631_0104370 [Cutaneotrichosporon cavernicola]BEJ03262.1 hypothetical protein CcaverHIS641_0104370 [Cutaneotrichosporon cavernicola]
MPPPDAAGLKIPCSTPQILQVELDVLATALGPPEREDTWEKMEKGIIRFTGVSRGGGYKHIDLFVRGVGNKGVGLRIVDCMMSDRGRLSGVSTDLLQAMAPRLASHFGPLVPLYLPPLVRLLARPNKVFFKRAEKCLATIILHCPLPTILIYLSHGLDDRSDQCKRASAIGIESAMIQWDCHRWSEKDLDLLELCVRKMATDRDGEVRKTARRVWGLFSELWSERVEDFMTPLTPTIRRYLDIPTDGVASKAKPRPGLRPRLQAAQAEAESSTRGNGSVPPAHGVGAPRTRSTSRGFTGERRQRVASGSVAEGSSSGLPRSASHNLLSHASSSSSLSKSESSRHRVLSKPSRPGQYAKEGELSNSTRRMAAPSRTASQASNRTDDEPRQTRSASASRPAMRPLRQAVSAESMTHASSSAADTTPDPASQPPSSSKSTVKERVNELEKKVEANGTPTAYRQSPSKLDLARAAAIPLPEDSPLASKSSLPSTRPQLPESPSFAMLLNRQLNSNDVHEMPTLLDLSMADMTIIAHSVTPGPAPRAQLSQPLKEVAPSPGSVAHLIGRFSNSSSETLSKSTPTRSGSSPLSATESTPTSRTASKSSPLSAEPPPDSSASTPSQRRISPLPRRSSTFIPSPDEDDSPNHSLKRKGSDIELSFTESTPVPRAKVAPRFSQPLIAFGETPTRRQSIRPFVFGANHAGFFDDLMDIQSGEGDEDEIVYEGFTQLIEGLVVDTDEPASFEDFLATLVPAAAPPALEPEAMGETPDLLDLGNYSVTTEGGPGSVEENRSVEPTGPEDEDLDQTVIVRREEAPDNGAGDADVTAVFVTTEESDSRDQDVAVVAPPRPTEDPTPPVQAAPVLVAQAQAPDGSPTPAPKSELSFEIHALALSMAATALQSPAPQHIGSPQSISNVAETISPHWEPTAPATSATWAAVEIVDLAPMGTITTPAKPSPARFTSATPGTIPVEEATSVISTPVGRKAVQDGEQPVERPVMQLEERPKIPSEGQPCETLQETSREKPQGTAVERRLENPDATVLELFLATMATSAIAEPVVAPQAAGIEPHKSVPIAEAEKPTTPADAPVLAPVTQPAPHPAHAPDRARGHMRSTTAPMKPTHTSARLGPPSKTARPTPAEKKSFKPVSRLGMTDSGKSAPAPARLAMATKASNAKAAAAPAPTAARKAPPAPTGKTSSAPSSMAPSRGPSRPPSRQLSRAASPLLEQGHSTLAQSMASSSTIASKPPKTATKPISNLLKPTAAAAARAAATAVMKEKELAKEVKPNRPPPAMSSRPPTQRAVSSSRPAGGLFAPTVASRARAEAALPPSKRQRVKLKAPMESFKPGRGRSNLSKAAALGSVQPRSFRDIRTKKGEKGEKVETFPLPGPRLASSTSEMPVEVPVAPVVEQTAPSLNVPPPQDETEIGIAQTPTTLSPLAHSEALSPASSRHTDRSYDSSKSSPRKMRPSPSRPLDPVLTPLHHTPSGLSDTANPTRSGNVSRNDSPATVHARRISGIPSSVERLTSTSRERNRGDEHNVVSEEEEEHVEKEGVTNVVRHDVSTPQGKASSLLAKLSTERRVLTARDGNTD